MSEPPTEKREAAEPEPQTVDLVLDLVRLERAQQSAQFDAVDAKAGSMLGFSAVVLGLIATMLAVTSDWLWALAYLPATVAAIRCTHDAYHAMRVVRFERQNPRESFNAWMAFRRREAAARQAVADETRTMEANEPIIQGKIEHLRRAEKEFGWAAALLATGIVSTLVGRALVAVVGRG